MSRSRSSRSSKLRAIVTVLALSGCGVEQADTEATSSALEAAPNPAGTAETFHTSGGIDRTNPFFQRLGINDRTCETCHAANQGWAITASATTALFNATGGLAAIFNPLDEGARPDADVSTVDARRATYDKTLLRLALTRFPQNIPATAEFTVIAVDDPSRFSQITPTLRLTRFRRPTATANEAKVASTNWTAGPQPDLPAALAATVNGAARFHAQRPDTVPVEQQIAARDFQLGIFFAQTVDKKAGRLDAAGAKGGPVHLAAQPFYVGINDMTGADPTGRPFSRKVFDIFDAWSVFNTGSSGSGSSGSGSSGSGSGSSGSGSSGSGSGSDRDRARAAIYRGQEIFNFHQFPISGVRGINDVFGQATVQGTCSTCHNVPNVGGHAVFRMFDIGAADEDNCAGDIPVLTIQHNVTGEIRKVCDLCRGGNGIWADVGGFRAPPLRGLAARAPFFQDGKARDIKEVVEFYQHRFDLDLSGSDRDDLVAFLSAL
jgi:cytochrome c peroxidase